MGNQPSTNRKCKPWDGGCKSSKCDNPVGAIFIGHSPIKAGFCKVRTSFAPFLFFGAILCILLSLVSIFMRVMST